MLIKTASAAMALLLAGGPALAQDGPIASARPVDSTDAQIRQYLDQAAATPQAGEEAAPAAADNAPHGEFAVGIGTGGYRHAHAATVVPVGDVGTAAIAVSDTRFNDRFGPRKQQSLSVAVALGQGAKPASACVRERPAKAPEPMWVTRMRGAQAAAGGAACPTP